MPHNGRDADGIRNHHAPPITRYLLLPVTRNAHSRGWSDGDGINADINHGQADHRLNIYYVGDDSYIKNNR